MPRKNLNTHCLRCGKQFSEEQLNGGSHQYKFCSLKCRDKARYAPPEDRFWAKVRKTKSCWLWTGGPKNFPYGYIGYTLRHKKNKRCYVHRFSWELHNGPIPTGLLVCHTCDTPKCVNPAHLFLGTSKDNLQDASRKGRMTARGQGFRKLTEENIKQIRKMAHKGFTYVEIISTLKLKCGRTAISNVVTGLTWKNTY